MTEMFRPTTETFSPMTQACSQTTEMFSSAAVEAASLPLAEPPTRLEAASTPSEVCDNHAATLTLCLNCAPFLWA
jgi:hypothetical protein